MSTQTSPADAGRSTGPSLLGVVTDAQTYENLLYLLFRFPLGVAYFVALVTTISVGVSLIPLVVGVGILALVLPAVTYLGYLEAIFARSLLDRDIEYQPPDPRDEPLVPYLKRVATDARSYVLLVYAFLTFPVGIGLFTLLVLLATFSLGPLAAPLLYNHAGVQYKIGTVDAVGGVGPFVVDTLPEALVLSGVGLVVGIAGLHLCNALARIHGAVLARVLS